MYSGKEFSMKALLLVLGIVVSIVICMMYSKDASRSQMLNDSHRQDSITDIKTEYNYH
jgi:ABC-type cobalt transport system substrate-binding protein